MLSHVEGLIAEQHPEGARPRMVISKMVLRNFKSYAGTVEIGPFHKSFTSIVGPNGSGKSNVIDSLLFVFGFKAKKMRQGKLSELIHNSTHHQNLDSCSVEVHFREIIDLPGPDAFSMVEGSDLVVSRSVERGGSDRAPDKSIYRINGRTSSFTEVTGLLKSKGVDLEHKRFLILQGEVESISLMKPKAQNEHEDGLLEYLEDIIGTSRYKQPIEDANKQLDELNEERSEKLNRLKFVERDKKSLESKRKDAEDFIHTENLLKKKKNALYHIYLAECTLEIASLSSTIESLNVKQEGESRRFMTLKEEVNSLEERHSTIQNDYNTIAAKAKSVRDELQRYDRAEVELKEKEAHLQKKLKKLSSALHKESLQRSENETWIRNFDADMEKATMEAGELASRLAAEEKALETIRESLKGKTEVFQKQIEKKQEELAPWMEKINEKQAALDVASSERELLEQKITSSKTALKEAEQKVVELRALLGRKQKELSLIRESQEALEAKNISLQKAMQECTIKEQDLRKSVTQSRQKADEAKVSLQAAQTRGKVHTSLIQQSHTGRIPGICGRLGDLGVIDDAYDIAVTTACGALDAIVVDTVDAGQQCIEFLRKQSLGRATFICLDKLKQGNREPIDTPERVPRLFDLIKPKHPKYAQAFYQVLQDTLVAKDLEQANRIAFGNSRRYRVVTLDGQLIDTSGTMSGGGNKPQRGGMSSKFAADGVTQATVVQLEKEKEQIEGVLQELLEKRRQLEQQIDECGRQLPAVELELTKVEMDVKSLQEGLADAEKHAEIVRTQQQGPSTEDLSRRDELNSIISKLTKQTSNLQESATVIQEDIKELQGKILEVGGVRLRTQQAKVDGVNEEIGINNTRMTKLQVERSTRDKAVAKILKSIHKNQTELDSVKTEIESIDADLERQRSAASQVKGKVQEAQQVLETKETELEQIKEILDVKTEEINEMRKLQVETKAQLERAKEGLATKLKQQKYYQNEISCNLRLQSTGFESDDEDLELEQYTAEQLGALDKEEVEADIQKLQAKVNEGTPNLTVLEEYRQKREAYLAQAKVLEEVTLRRDEAKKSYDELRNKRLAEFMEGFTAISQKLKEMYQMITLGGNAELELVDSLDPFSEGIIFSVMPPKKSWKNISNLSGGEKTLSSLALVFALHHFKPTPLYVMDEIDAALDFRNVSIVANYIKERTKNAQFVIISLRNNMFELADRLVGIYKTDNTTKSITINPTAVA
ncbi:uncharacterized protein SPPG_02770 [Spizellomyces punctatus DAOM BR117]|uniref:Structural maintenance of chromosomes protein n=1 Tax=Spizellomyces punctatus (strain DAOM BR117) TaxID=645134 RepID=A0A0L0HMZ4_SPIPD|nr:uncharacterized protein SPPG_02770 [Spizellomyces punctatus DAOM BR117]KND02295.1 hypothetical protein SPPG_02770 [Spizellomyces punctatus DAOM BR117]|eukprot:XP_016610334.1 hypothetical protein SPPG_02770 [Spizellomyces punctatus DAOM BR117]